MRQIKQESNEQAARIKELENELNNKGGKKTDSQPQNKSQVADKDNLNKPNEDVADWDQIEIGEPVYCETVESVEIASNSAAAAMSIEETASSAVVTNPYKQSNSNTGLKNPYKPSHTDIEDDWVFIEM